MNLRSIHTLWIAAVLVILPFLLEDFTVFQVNLMLVYAIAILGLNVLTGYGGQISLGHGAFYAIGAYTAAVLMEHAQMSAYLTLPIAALISLVAGILVGFPALRLAGHYLALATFALAMVKHSTKKPFRQKGTGNARAGMTSSPLWRGGGRIFPNSPDENFTQKLNKKMYRAGMASIFSQLVREGRLAVVDSIKLDSPKTKQLADKFKAMNLKSVLVIADEIDENLYLASRNLPHVLVVEPRYADPLSLVHYKKVIVTKGAIDKLKEMFA